MKILKYISLLWLIIAISSAIANYGNELTKHPVVIVVVLIISSIGYGVSELLDD